MNKSLSVNRAKQCALKDQFKVGSQSNGQQGFASKLANSNRSISNTKNFNLHNLLTLIYQMIPEMSDISDKYSNLTLMSSLSVLHKDRIKTLL